MIPHLPLYNYYCVKSLILSSMLRISGVPRISHMAHPHIHSDNSFGYGLLMCEAPRAIPYTNCWRMNKLGRSIKGAEVSIL